jgi:hypothetical protein
MTIIDIPGTKRVPFNVTLVGIGYRALPPKALISVAMGKKLQAAGSDIDKIISELEGWLSSIFGRKVSPDIMARLQDPDDDIDLKDIMELIKKLSEQATGNPTT